MKIKHPAAFLILFLWPFFLYSQQHCKDTVSFQSISTSQGNDTLALKVNFDFMSDSLFMRAPRQSVKGGYIAAFKILSKECVSKDSGSVWEAKYSLELDDDGTKKYPKVLVRLKPGNGQLILNYEGQESRVFQLRPK